MSQLYIEDEDRFEMQDIDDVFNYIPDETNDSIIYMKNPTPISVGVKRVRYFEDETEEKEENVEQNIISDEATFSKIDE